VGAGRPPIMDHQLRMKGRRVTQEEADKLSLKQRRRIDVPLKPPQFLEKKNRELSQIWDDHVDRAPWLLEADTAKLIMFCYQWRTYMKDPDGQKSAYLINLRTLASELGLDPLSRTRMKRAHLPVEDFSDYPSHAGKAGKRKDLSKKEGRKRRRHHGEESERTEETRGKFDRYA